MGEINYQALRIAAENATPGEWCTDDYGVIADAGLNANYYIASCSGPDNRANKRFIAAANPATVLALLDELEAAEKRIAELEAREILLPERSSMLHRTDFHEDYHTVMAYKVSDVIAAIRAAGIRIKGE
ncbi:ead/Ea22-like family protein [Salmonella enterica]|nr:ead/Ea22-like family protein [Salmonella enterica]